MVKIRFISLIIILITIQPVLALHQDIYVTNLTSIAGTFLEFNQADLDTINNANITIQEGNGVPPVLEYNITFIVEDLKPDYLILYGKYNGSGGHTVNIKDSENNVICTVSENTTFDYLFCKLNYTDVLEYETLIFMYEHESSGNLNHYAEYDLIKLNASHRDQIRLILNDYSIFSFDKSFLGYKLFRKNQVEYYNNNRFINKVNTDDRLNININGSNQIVLKPSKISTITNPQSFIINMRKYLPMILVIGVCFISPLLLLSSKDRIKKIKRFFN